MPHPPKVYRPASIRCLRDHLCRLSRHVQDIRQLVEQDPASDPARHDAQRQSLFKKAYEVWVEVEVAHVHARRTERPHWQRYAKSLIRRFYRRLHRRINACPRLQSAYPATYHELIAWLDANAIPEGRMPELKSA